MDARTVRGWLSRIDKDTKEERNRRIFELWLACHTYDEIKDDVGLTKEATRQVCQETATLPKLDKTHRAAAEHASDFDAPIGEL